MKRTNWFERKFAPIDDNGLLPGIIERLEGTPARLATKLARIEAGKIARPVEDKWSIAKETGHLGDLEPLWLARVLDLRAGAPALAPADLTNRKTHETDHDSKTPDALLDEFRVQRERLVEALRSLADADLERSATHPRLGTPMRIIDLAYFVAEHDDHHLAQITTLAG